MLCKAEIYHWIRALGREELRLPAMVVSEWTSTTQAEHVADRARIYEALSQRLPFFSVEMEILGTQWPLL